MEGARSCMNTGCGTAVKADEWRKGWGLRSGGFAILCEACGMAYEQQIFCDMFHSKETGWRECSSCHKRLHCGCIASASLFELADTGGIQCVGCKDNLNLSSTSLDILHSTPAKNALDEEANATKGNSAVNTITLGEGKAMLLDENPEINNQGSTNGLPELVKKEQMISGMGTLGNTNFPKLSQVPYGPLNLSHDESKDKFVDKAIQDSLLPGCFALVSQSVMEGYNARSSQDVESPSRTVHETREQSKAQAVVQQWQRSCCLLPKPSRITLFEAAKDALPNMRVARPPAEGRGRPQLLPRYWPRITDQELRQISGDSNSTIVPLFEKVLSASDAGRIGRLVLPKACAEAYFPPISQPEGLPIKIQDAKGKDWVFQFRFWPNNNSRMYVLEGVTPCIQSMQLQAGDTVTFSRIDPEGKLVMGFRKATNTVPLQDSQISALANGSFGSENFLSGVLDNQPIVSSYPGIFQSIKGSTIHQLNSSSEFDGGMYWQKMEGQGHKSIEGLQLQQFSGSEKRSQNIGPKRKRLHIDNEDAVELKMTWDEAQDLLRPPQSIQPSIVMVEDFEFEEYEEPPVFGKRTVITSRISGEFDQWAQCDSCSKWRRLPVDVILSSSRWTCAENFWDTKSSSCTESEEINPVELNNLLQQNADIRKQKLAAFRVSVSPEEEMPGINAPATAASLGDDASPSTSSAAITTKQPRPRPDCTSLGDDASPSTSSVAITTKHPRHRPGCTCIVCIQPPSGKGPKHKPTCTCNVCSTVKRRFKTLMMRKKKRQSESEDVEVHKRVAWDKQDAGEDGSQKGALLDFHHDAETGNGAILADVVKGKIDLNFNPKRGEEGSDLSHANLASLHVPNFSLEVYIKQNELSGFIYDEQASSSPPAIPEVLGELERNTPDECLVVSASQEKDSGVDEEHNVSDLASNDGL